MPASITAIITPHRKMLRLQCLDSAGNPDRVVSVGTAPILRAGGVPMTLDTPIHGNGSNSVIYPILGTVPDGAVTIEAVEGYVVPNSGPAAATFGQVAVAMPARLLPAPAPASGTMRVGYNLGGQYYGSTTIQIYSNLVKNSTWGNPGEFGIVAIDDRGYPTVVAGLNFMINIADRGTDYGGSDLSVNMVPPGQYSFLNRPGVVAFIPRNGTTDTIITQISGPIAYGGGTRAVHDYRPQTDFSPTIQAFLQGTLIPETGNYSFNVDGTLAIYPPDPADPTGDTPWDSPSKYWPGFKAQYGAAQGWRWMDGGAINGGNIYKESDLHTLSSAGFSSTKRDTVAVTRVDPYTGTDQFFQANGSTLILVETTTPHGFLDGMRIGFGTGVGTIDSPGSDGVTHSALGNVGPRSIRVLSSTTFIAQLDANTSPSVATNSLVPTPGPTAVCMRDIVGGGIPSEDCGNVTAYLAASYLWRNCPNLATDALIMLIAQQDAATVPLGSTVVFEYANEIWNNRIPPANVQARGLARTMFGVTGDDFFIYAPWQVYRAIQAFRVYRAAWIEAGRSATDLEHFLGSWGGGGSTTLLLNYVRGAHDLGDGTTVDLINGNSTRTSDGTILKTFAPLGVIDGEIDLIGPSVYPNSDEFDASTNSPYHIQFDNFDLGQSLDLLESRIASNYIYDTLMGHQAAIAASSLVHKPRLAIYECNLNYVIPATPSTFSVNWRQRALAVHRNYLTYRIGRSILSQAEAAGAVKINIFYLNGGNADGHWDTYEGYSMRAGTGSPNENPDYTNLGGKNGPAVVSQMGGAVNDYINSAAVVSSSRPISSDPVHRRQRSA